MRSKGQLVHKFSKDGEHDMRGGPVRDRRCTDSVCLLLFVAHAVALLVLAFLAAGGGDLRRLYYPRDYRGEYCGLSEGGWAAGGSLRSFRQLALTVSVSRAADGPALALLCSDLGRRVLSDEDVSSACSATPPAQGGWSASGAAGLLGLGSLGAAPQDAAGYFSPVCVASCRLNSTGAGREYVYAPAPDTPWAGAWERLRTRAESGGFEDLRRALAKFRFPAWDSEACPYPAEYCIAVPGADYFEGPGRVCQLRPGEAAAREALARLAGWLRDAARLAAAAASAPELAGLAAHADTYFLMAVASLVIGLILMVLIRFCVKPVVLAIILLVGALLALGGAASLVRAGQCADVGFIDALLGASPSAVNTGAAASLDPEGCVGRGGYAVQSGQARDLLKVCGFSLCGMALLWVALIACLWRRIQLAIAASQVAAMFVFHTPQILLVPISQVVLGLGWIFLWCVLAGLILSSVPADQVPSEAFATKAEAMGTDDAPGACNQHWPAGFAWRDEASCAGPVGALRCWRCAPPRFALDYRFAYAVFSLLWHNALLIAVGQCIVAGATAVWFFTPRSRKARQASVLISTWMALRFHLGSLAFGSLVLACVQFLKLCMYYFSKQAQVHKNACAELIFNAVACVLRCFERFIKFLDKNAYIQVALRGTNFCASAKNAFSLLARNCVRFGALAALGRCVRLVGSAFIIAATGVAGYFALQAMYPEAAPAVPVLVFLAVGWVVGKLTMNVFALALDATLHCFIITEEMHHREGDFIPAALRKFLRDQDLQAERERGACGACASACWRPARKAPTAPG